MWSDYIEILVHLVSSIKYYVVLLLCGVFKTKTQQLSFD